jgi:hypothetical protein
LLSGEICGASHTCEHDRQRRRPASGVLEHQGLKKG